MKLPAYQDQNEKDVNVLNNMQTTPSFFFHVDSCSGENIGKSYFVYFYYFLSFKKKIDKTSERYFCYESNNN